MVWRANFRKILTICILVNFSNLVWEDKILAYPNYHYSWLKGHSWIASKYSQNLVMRDMRKNNHGLGTDDDDQYDGSIASCWLSLAQDFSCTRPQTYTATWVPGCGVAPTTPALCQPLPPSLTGHCLSLWARSLTGRCFPGHRKL